MMKIAAKYARLIDLLWIRTQEGSVSWVFDSERTVVKVWGPSSLIELARSVDENFDELYECTIFNKSGDVLEHFNDAFIHEVGTGDSFKSYFSKMEALFDLARRQSTGADKALDEVIDALEKDEFSSNIF